MRVQIPSSSLFPEIDFESKCMDSIPEVPASSPLRQILSPLSNATSRTSRNGWWEPGYLLEPVWEIPMVSVMSKFQSTLLRVSSRRTSYTHKQVLTIVASKVGNVIVIYLVTFIQKISSFRAQIKRFAGNLISGWIVCLRILNQELYRDID